jgi:uncharacterized Rossmann fold enzyme
MQIETIKITEEEQRILIIIDKKSDNETKELLDSYLENNTLSPKKEYLEERNGKDYLVYYFGHCYIEEHLENIGNIAGKK